MDATRLEEMKADGAVMLQYDFYVRKLGRSRSDRFHEAGVCRRLALFALGVETDGSGFSYVLSCEGWSNPRHKPNEVFTFSIEAPPVSHKYLNLVLAEFRVNPEFDFNIHVSLNICTLDGKRLLHRFNGSGDVHGPTANPARDWYPIAPGSTIYRTRDGYPIAPGILPIVEPAQGSTIHASTAPSDTVEPAPHEDEDL